MEFHLISKPRGSYRVDCREKEGEFHRLPSTLLAYVTPSSSLLIETKSVLFITAESVQCCFIHTCVAYDPMAKTIRHSQSVAARATENTGEFPITGQSLNPDQDGVGKYVFHHQLGIVLSSRVGNEI